MGKNYILTYTNFCVKVFKNNYYNSTTVILAATMALSSVEITDIFIAHFCQYLRILFSFIMSGKMTSLELPLDLVIIVNDVCKATHIFNILIAT